MPASDSRPTDARSQLLLIARDLDPAPFARMAVGPSARPASVLVLFSQGARHRDDGDGDGDGSSGGQATPRIADETVTGLPTPDATARSAPTGIAPADIAPAGLDVLLQVRASTLRQHAGQVSFPGGRPEPGDTDVVQTALREAAEETGLDPSGVDVLATLPALPLAASNHRVTPVLAWWANPIPLHAIDPAETTRVWQAPVSSMLDPASRFTFVVERRGHRFRGPAFDVEGTIVWGFTAMVLDRIFDAAGWGVPWDVSRERAVR